MPEANSITAWFGIWAAVGSCRTVAKTAPISVSTRRAWMHSLVSGGTSSPPAGPSSTSFTMSEKSIAPGIARAVSGRQTRKQRGPPLRFIR